MLLAIIAGLYALITGRMAITRTIRVSGPRARYFGVALIGVAVIIAPLLNRFAYRYLPPAFVLNDALRIATNAAFWVIVILLLAVAFRNREEPQSRATSERPPVPMADRAPVALPSAGSGPAVRVKSMHEPPTMAPPAPGSTPILSVRALEVSYGTIPALHGIDLDVQKGEIVTLIGANGAGKTTTLRTISGLLRPKKGDVTFNGQNISAIKPHVITKMGVSHVPEGRGIFANLTVEDNLELGGYLRKDSITKEEYERVFTLFPVLKDRFKQNAGTLSGGEQQMLAISRALMSKPSVLLLDEPSLGLAPQMVQTIFRVIKEINAEGTTILLVEQNAHMALVTAHRGYVMETGRIVLTDNTKALLASDSVKKAYLGG